MARQAGEQRLADQLVREAHPSRPVLRCRSQQVGVRRLVQRLQQRRLLLIGGGAEQREGNAPADASRRRERPPAGRTDVRQPLVEHQPHTRRHVQLPQRGARMPAARAIEQAARGGEVLVDLVHEEGVALGLGVDQPRERSRRLAAGKCGEQGGRVRRGEALEVEAQHGSQPPGG